MSPTRLVPCVLILWLSAGFALHAYSEHVDVRTITFANQSHEDIAIYYRHSPVANWSGPVYVNRHSQRELSAGSPHLLIWGRSGLKRHFGQVRFDGVLDRHESSKIVLLSGNTDPFGQQPNTFAMWVAVAGRKWPYPQFLRFPKREPPDERFQALGPYRSNQSLTSNR